MMDLNRLMDIRRAERSGPDFVPIEEGFYADVKRLLNDVGGKEEFKKIKQVFDDIVAMREHKIVAAALRNLQGDEAPELAGLELEVYNNVYESLKKLRDLEVEEAEKANNGKETKSKEAIEEKCVFKSRGDKIKVKFLKPLPAFVSLTGSCGPFREDEEIELPASIAELLLKNGVVEEIV